MENRSSFSGNQRDLFFDVLAVWTGTGGSLLCFYAYACSSGSGFLLGLSAV